MKISKTRTLLLTVLVLGVLLVFPFIWIVHANFEVVPCICTCKGEVISAKGYGENPDEATKSCIEMCGRACGAKTECNNDCGNCCETSDKGCGDITYEQGKEGCKDSCSKTCDFKSLTNGIIDIIYTAAGIVAAIMIIIHGFKFISSQNPEDRDEAKKAILFVIFALIMIGISGVVVNFFIGRTITAGVPGLPKVTTVTGCGHDFKVKNTQSSYTGSKFTFEITNDGDKDCKYRFILYDGDGNQIDGSEDKEVKKGIYSKITKTLWAYDWKGGYIAKLYNLNDLTTPLATKEYKCKGELKWDPSVLKNPEISGSDITFYLTVINPSQIVCKYDLELRSKDNQVVDSKRDVKVCTKDCTGGVIRPGKWSTSLKGNIGNAKGEYKIVLLTKGQEISHLERNFISKEAKTEITKIGNSIIKCWNTCKESGVDKDALCMTDNLNSLKDEDVITEKDVKQYLKTKGGEDANNNLEWKVGGPIRQITGGICVKFNLHFGGLFGNKKKIQILKSSDSGCSKAEYGNIKPMKDICK